MSDNVQKKLKESNDRLLIAEEKLVQLSISDDLTGLLNRRGINQWIESELVRFSRSGSPFTLLLMDIDFFKTVNDSYGHRAGDYVLQQISEIISTSIRAQDSVGRWGGEEFLFALPDTDCKGGRKIAEKIRKIVENKKMLYNNIDIRVTVSFGGCCMNKGITLDSCLELADKSLYKSKEEGRNRVNIYEY